MKLKVFAIIVLSWMCSGAEAQLMTQIENVTLVCTNAEENVEFSFDLEKKPMRIWQAMPNAKVGFELKIDKDSWGRCADVCFSVQASLSAGDYKVTYELNKETQSDQLNVKTSNTNDEKADVVATCRTP